MWEILGPPTRSRHMIRAEAIKVIRSGTTTPGRCTSNTQDFTYHRYPSLISSAQGVSPVADEEDKLIRKLVTSVEALTRGVKYMQDQHSQDALRRAVADTDDDTKDAEKCIS